MGGPNLDWFPELVSEYPPAAKYSSSVEEFSWWAGAESEYNIRLSEENHLLRMQIEELQGFQARRRFLVEYQTSIFDKGSGYNNLIISAGYAALFATWSTTANLMSPFENRLIALLALCSLAFFVGWEIAKMINAGTTTQRLATVINSSDTGFDEAEETFRAYSSKSEQRFRRIWVFQMIVTLAFGLASAGVLTAALVGRLFQ